MTNEAKAVKLFPAIASYLSQRQKEWDRIPETRRRELEQLAGYVQERLSESTRAQLTFICTHNSRRSHLSQIWAKVAADSLGLTGVLTYSGGTEATAMNERVVESLRRTGFEVSSANADSENPHYAVHYADDADSLICFSKVYDQAPNPDAGYCAIMTCSSADAACPMVPGCDLRLPIRYEDPKVSDGTSQEAAVYDERSAQICREMLYAMTQVNR